MGPTPLALGPHQFEALGFGFSDLSDDLKTPWDELKVAQALETLHWTGPSSQDFSIKGALFPEVFGGAGTLQAIRDDAEAGVPQMLVAASGHVYGRVVITGVQKEERRHDARGEPRHVTYTISLKRYSGQSSMLPLLDLF